MFQENDNTSDNMGTNSDLQAIANAWPNLSEATRAKVLKLIRLG